MGGVSHSMGAGGAEVRQEVEPGAVGVGRTCPAWALPKNLAPAPCRSATRWAILSPYVGGEG